MIDSQRHPPSITYLSEPMKVSMADEWFDIADVKHFWIRRRFEVFQNLAKRCELNLKAINVAEIGCGNGLIQYQIQRSYKIQVDGFDLNEVALQKSIALNNSLFLYDIHQRNPDYQQRYDLIILFDVIEHIEDQEYFLESVLYHLKPSGILAVNVPALQFLYSKYDLVVGHVRRYNRRDLKVLGNIHQLKSIVISYWGLPLIPLLVLRKWISRLLRDTSNESKTVSSGFYPPSQLVNTCLYWLSKLEFTPQKLIGTSLMAFYKKPQ